MELIAPLVALVGRKIASIAVKCKAGVARIAISEEFLFLRSATAWPGLAR
jgi:hypothetical protein